VSADQLQKMVKLNISKQHTI